MKKIEKRNKNNFEAKFMGIITENLLVKYIV